MFFLAMRGSGSLTLVVMMLEHVTGSRLASIGVLGMREEMLILDVWKRAFSFR